MQVAFYKAPGTWLDALIRLLTRSIYSHCELVIDGICYTSSNRDGGVRSKAIYLDTEKWDVFDIPHNKDLAKAWFTEHYGQSYDWLGAVRIVLPFLPNSSNKWFCSEACAAALGIENPGRQTPATLYHLLVKRE